MEIELNVPETEITGKDISVETGNTNIAVSEDIKDLDITYNRKEYSIIGDGIFISSVLDDVPEWLGNLIDSTFEAAILNRNQSLINRMEAILTALDYVPKNKYTEQINQIVDEDGIINTRIATLNSNLTDALTTANATIAEIDLTYASKNEAAAIATNVLTASLSADGEIGSTLINLQNAYADLESTTAESITLLESIMEGEINGNASAMQTIRSYVGIDEAGASTGTGLSAYLEDSNGVIGGADSQLNNTIKVTAEGIESKFAYNSVVNINGIYKKSGFGLTTNYTSGSGTAASPYVSEFWIDASRLKFTNSNQTGKASPFTIDATGTTPKITFNGLVTFGSGQSGTIDEAIAAVVETVSVGDKNINITDNLIPVTSFVADTDNSGYQLIGNPVKSISAGYDNYSEAQLSMDSNDEAYSPYVDEMNSSYYYRFAIKGITSLNNFKIATISAANVVTYSVVTVTMNSGQTLSSTSWYLVDGLINPYGGNTSADGSIRNSSGTKIGTITNFVLPSSANKMVLGWLGTAIISRMKLCTVTADTIMSDFTSVNATLVANQTQIDASTQLLADMANDNKLTPSEKSETLKEWTRIQSEKTLNTTQAATYSVTSTAYTTAYNSLSSYVTPILSSMSTTSDIVGTTFRSTFKSYYDENTKILNAIATKINANAQSYANSAVSTIAWQSEVQAAINNNATYIDGGKIVTGSIAAGKINTTGLIAENISANEIVGKTITGGIINGARINGAVIKASYLDLNGDLEVLTNFIISVATRNANPSLYIDAVYISADNQYRIPSLSGVREETKSVHITGVGNWYGKLRSYNTANAGHNLKAVKIRPSFNNSQNFNIITSTSSSGMSYDAVGTVSNHFSLYLGGVALLTAHIQYFTGMETRVTISGTYFTTIVKDLNNYFGTDGTSHGNSLNLGFGVCSLSIIEHRDSGSDANGLKGVTVSVNLNTGEYLLPFNWTSNGIQFTQHVKPRTLAYENFFRPGYNGYTIFNLNQSLSINNMI